MFMKKNLTYKKINHSIAEKHNQVQIFEIFDAQLDVGGASPLGEQTSSLFSFVVATIAERTPPFLCLGFGFAASATSLEAIHQSKNIREQ